MDRRNRKGNIMIETLIIATLFASMLVIFESKIKPQLEQKNKNRWENSKND